MTSADSGPVIGVDLGKARIGVAVSDGLRLCANPLSVLRAHGTDEDIDALVRLAREHDAVAFVVGLPLNMDGTESDGSRAARELSAALERAGGLPVTLWDERLSTVEAQEMLKAGTLGRKKRRALIDAAAAVVILQSWLDALRLRSGQAQGHAR